MKIFKRLLFILLMTTAILLANNITSEVGLVSWGGFKDADSLLDNSQQYAEITSPNAQNQFVILDLRHQLQVTTINVMGNSSFNDNEISVFTGQNILSWTMVKSHVSIKNNLIIIVLDNNMGRYLKIVFGNKKREAPLRIKKLELYKLDKIFKQDIIKIDIPERLITTRSVVIKYKTEQPSSTYILYGTNFDFIYDNKIENVYSNATPVEEHSVVLQNLLPKVTYVYVIVAEDVNKEKVRSGFLYFSTE